VNSGFTKVETQAALARLVVYFGSVSKSTPNAGF